MRTFIISGEVLEELAWKRDVAYDEVQVSAGDEDDGHEEWVKTYRALDAAVESAQSAGKRGLTLIMVRSAEQAAYVACELQNSGDCCETSDPRMSRKLGRVARDVTSAFGLPAPDGCAALLV